MGFLMGQKKWWVVWSAQEKTCQSQAGDEWVTSFSIENAVCYLNGAMFLGSGKELQKKLHSS